MSNLQDPNIALVNELNYDSEVLAANVPVLIDVSATWCAPCKAAAPVVREIARKYAGKLKVVEIDGDESPELVAKLGVRGFPTFIGVAKGELAARAAGFAGKTALVQFADRLVTGA